jgi:hypothetical protein
VTTSKLLLPELSNGAGNYLLANQTFNAIDQAIQLRVVDKDLATPPGSPANGAAYIVAAAATGAWAGKETQIAYWITAVNAWQFLVPANGWLAWVTDESLHYRLEGGSWVELATGGGASLPVVQTFTGNKVLALSDINTYNASQDASPQSVTIPAQASVAWTADAEMHFERRGTGSLTITGDTGVSVNGVSAGSFALPAQYSAATLKRISSDDWTLIYASLDADLQALADNSTNGLWARTGSGTGAARTITGTANKVTVTNGDGVSGNPTLTIPDAVTLVTPTVSGSINLTGGQIAFPATQVPSANANTLDDYEEGTWTPVLTFATPGDLSVTYSQQYGIYTKIGRQVSTYSLIVTSSFTHTTASGALRITGLPFPVTASSPQGYPGTTTWGGITKATHTQASTRAVGGQSYFDILVSGSGVSVAQIMVADTPSGGTVRLDSSNVYFE